MIIEFSVVPVGAGEELAGPVARLLDIIDGSGLPYQLTSMGTLVEGDWDEVMDLVRKCHARMREEASRVLTRISIDDRQGARGRLTGKIRDVENILGRPLKK